MELEEAIQYIKRICEYLKESDYMSIDKDTKISLEIVLNHFIKQEKIIEYGIESKEQLRKEIERKAEEV